MINDDFVFKIGKYAGKTYKFVKEINPQYIEWAKSKAPNILKEKNKKQPSEEKVVNFGKLPENTDFLN